MYVASRVLQFGSPAVLRGKSFNVGHYPQTVQPHFVIPAILEGMGVRGDNNDNNNKSNSYSAIRH